MKRMWILALLLSIILDVANVAYAEDKVPGSVPAPVSAQVSVPPVPVQEKKGLGILGIDLSVEPMYLIYEDEFFRGGKGIKAKLGYREVPFLRGLVSLETAEQRLYGQTAGDLLLLGFGLEGRVQPIKGVPLIVFVEGAYYIPYSDIAGIDKCREGEGYYWTVTLRGIGLTGPFWEGFNNHYKYEIKPSFGGTVGLQIQQPIYKSFSVGLAGGYRFLRLPENWDATNADNLIVQTKDRRDLSAFQICGVLSISF